MPTKLVLAVIVLMLGTALATPVSTGGREQTRSGHEVMQEEGEAEPLEFQMVEAPQSMVGGNQRNKRSTGRGDY